jgi:flavin-dependent dehydrogenase
MPAEQGATAVSVLVLGGGPVGLASAIAVSRLASSDPISVLVLERRRLCHQPIGETLGPEARPTLQALGVWEDFLALGPVPFRGVRSAWGSDKLIERLSITRPLGEGWHIDRARFERCLADHAARVGAVIWDKVGLPSLRREGAAIVATLPDGRVVRARFVIDATGRGATGTTALTGSRYLACDRQVAMVARLPLPHGHPMEPVLHIESAEHGWWYVAPQPDRSLLFCYLTDADLLAGASRDRRAASFHAALAQTRHVRALACGARFLSPPRIVRAECGRLVPDRGPSFCAVGDAAFAGDPLSGDGLARGLRSALAAAPLALDPAAAPPPPAAGDAFRAYQETRARYYGMEARWPDSLFWLRRRPSPPEPVTLHPLARLSYDGRAISPLLLAPIEALAPPRALRAALDRLQPGCLAHEALSTLRAAAPLDDLRLLLALQRLLSAGVIQTT